MGKPSPNRDPHIPHRSPSPPTLTPTCISPHPNPTLTTLTPALALTPTPTPSHSPFTRTLTHTRIPHPNCHLITSIAGRSTSKLAPSYRAWRHGSPRATICRGGWRKSVEPLPLPLPLLLPLPLPTGPKSKQVKPQPTRTKSSQVKPQPTGPSPPAPAQAPTVPDSTWTSTLDDPALNAQLRTLSLERSALNAQP